MIFAIALLLIVIIISLIFKYYIFKYRIFKENILEGLEDLNENLNFEAVNTIPIMDTTANVGKNIYGINEQILQLKDYVNQNTSIKQQKDTSYNQLSGNLTNLQTEYRVLDREYKQVLEDNKKIISEIKEEI
jgi:hypothetical protein